jgi:hypothetical protein
MCWTIQLHAFYACRERVCKCLLQDQHRPLPHFVSGCRLRSNHERTVSGGACGSVLSTTAFSVHGHMADATLHFLPMRGQANTSHPHAGSSTC